MWQVGDGMGWWMLWGGLLMVPFWGAIIALAVWGVQAVTRREIGRAPLLGSGASPRPPLEIAKEWYVRGDVTREEFEQIKKDLEDS